MTARVVVVPAAPLVLPQLTGPATTGAEPLRAACAEALRLLLDGVPSRVVVIGTGRVTHRHRDGAWGTTAGFGAVVDAPAASARRARGAGSGGPTPSLPLPLTVGARLLDDAGWTGPLVLQEVAAAAPPGECLDLGRRLAAEPEAAGSGWLVVADGTARRGGRAPGGFDRRAEIFDAEVVAALAQGSAERLARLDPELAAELGVAGRAAWQVLAGACPAPYGASVRYAAAPFGVGYVVAVWTGER